MRKIFTAIAASATALAGLCAPVDFKTLPDGIWDPHEQYVIGTADSDWATKAYDGNPWKVTSAGSKPSGYSYLLSNSSYEYEDNDSWLRSPALSMTAGNKYAISLQYRFQGASGIKLNAWVNPNDPTSGIIGETAVKNTKAFLTTTATPSTWQKVEYEFTPGESGIYYLSFQLFAQMYDDPGGTLHVGAISVREIRTIAIPAAPTGLTATPDPDGNIEVSLSWILPTTDTDGTPLDGNNAITRVLVYRDGELAATLNGTPSSWTDTAESGLTPGEHSYQVAAASALAEGVKSMEATTGYVGPFVYAPDEISFGPWDRYTGSGMGFVPFTSQKPAGQKNCASIWSFSEIEDENAWLISPEFNLDPSKTYRVKFQYLLWPEIVVENFDVYASTVKPSADTETSICAGASILSLDNLGNQASGAIWESATIENIKGNGPTYILFHVSGRYCKRFGISAFEIEEYKAEAPFEPMAPTGVEAEQGNGLEVMLNWVLPTESTTGSPFGEGVAVESVKVWRDDTEAATLDGAATTWTDTEADGLTYGTHTYTVQALVNGVWSAKSEAASIDVADLSAPQELPWAPVLQGLDNETFAAEWTTFNGESHGYGAGSWIPRPAGIFLNNTSGRAEDAWLISRPLQIEAGKSYILDYTITSTVTAEDATGNGGTVSIGLTDSTDPEFARVLSENIALPSKEEPATVKFSMPNARSAESCPRLAIRACSPEGSATHNIIVRSLRLTVDNVGTGVDEVTAAAQGAVEVFDLQGRSLGKADSAALNGFAKGLYIVRLPDGTTRKTIK